MENVFNYVVSQKKAALKYFEVICAKKRVLFIYLGTGVRRMSDIIVLCEFDCEMYPFGNITPCPLVVWTT